MTTRKRRAVITEETTRRQIVLTDTETDTIVPVTEPIRFAPGWHGVPRLAGAQLREQRRRQVYSCLDFLVIRVTDPNVRDTVQCAANVLRAGPGASLAEARHGRVT